MKNVQQILDEIDRRIQFQEPDYFGLGSLKQFILSDDESKEKCKRHWRFLCLDCNEVLMDLKCDGDYLAMQKTLSGWPMSEPECEHVWHVEHDGMTVIGNSWDVCNKCGLTKKWVINGARRT